MTREMIMELEDAFYRFHWWVRPGELTPLGPMQECVDTGLRLLGLRILERT